MRKNNVGRDMISDPLTKLLRTGAERLICQAVEIELLELLAEHSERRTEDGKAGVVRNGHLPGRELQTGLGPVTVQIPKVRAKSGEPVTFHSALVPSYVCKTSADRYGKRSEAGDSPIGVGAVVWPEWRPKGRDEGHTKSASETP
ncbi:MAG: hypothetical protein KZQ66_12875, partial [Candidatus Thiodiazotropha sp. (ex Lucinoma aequizonata)]|nr:hypothetical protein [Candidatus Thiodiazotropha sp. (ex Lucinoma aequizonata)]MCU7899995.1 hypothetical protein [Candidatus Thiodiazotropha sp. (ex Lucinoma aequizonata)]MCU7902776.1 hypothetical protein [Candidatus Thiodiazotropha sp. (ex Lucinoma aequizonata)]